MHEHKLTDDGGQLAEPPSYIIEAARLQAVQSPCSKSKRGVVLFNEEEVMRYVHGFEFVTSPVHSLVDARGFNGPPKGFGCLAGGDGRGDAACREACPRICMHAEQRAILEYVGVDSLERHDLVHVKVVEGVVVAGGPPSCLECSRLVVEVGLRGVWLLEAERWHDESRCEVCRQITTIAQGKGTTGVCERCSNVGRLLGRWKRIYAADSGVWRWYSGAAFHRATLRENGLLDHAIDQLAAGGAT